MNVNPHLQYLQQLQSQQQPLGQSQSTPVSQLQMQQQRHLQQQRQQLLNLHLQQQPPGGSGNPLLAALNGGLSSQSGGGVGAPGNGGSNMNFGQNVNPLLQLQLQQLQQQSQSQQQQQQIPQQQIPQQRLFSNPSMQQQQQQSHHLQQHPIQPQQQVPIIKEVWNFNLEHEFNALRTFINDKTSTIFISIHQEIPGIVARPVGTFNSSSDYHFQTLRSNADLLNLIQLSLCAVKVRNNEISNSVIWQFNFLYDLTKEMFNEEHLSMLSQTSQINFASHMSQGIPHFTFAELMMESGLLLDPSINWLSYHSGYDLGFLISLLTNDLLPNDEKDFFWWCTKYFPNFYDLKHIGTQLLVNGSAAKSNAGGLNNSSANNDLGGLSASAGNGGSAGDINKGLTLNNKPSVEYLAEELHLLPISPVIRQYFTSPGLGQFSGHQHQQMTSTLHAYLLMECFKELFRQSSFDFSVFENYKGYLWGLGDVFEGVSNSDSNNKAKYW